jgi:hypothetical protein
MRRIFGLVWQQQSLIIFRIRPEEVITVSAEVHDAAFTSASIADVGTKIGDIHQLPGNLRDELRAARPDQRVHLALVDGRVASWGFSVIPRGAWPLTETQCTLHVEDGAVCLFAFETLPQYRGRRLYPCLLSTIVSDRFREGATTAYIWCASGNHASYASIKRVGFKEITSHHYRRVLGVSASRTSPAAPRP